MGLGQRPVLFRHRLVESGFGFLRRALVGGGLGLGACLGLRLRVATGGQRKRTGEDQRHAAGTSAHARPPWPASPASGSMAGSAASPGSGSPSSTGDTGAGAGSGARAITCSTDAVVIG